MKLHLLAAGIVSVEERGVEDDVVGQLEAVGEVDHPLALRRSPSRGRGYSIAGVMIVFTPRPAVA